MRTSIAVGSTLAIALLVGGVMAEEGIKSGPQPVPILARRGSPST
jgi:hypothetical protein